MPGFPRPTARSSPCSRSWAPPDPVDRSGPLKLSALRVEISRATSPPTAWCARRRPPVAAPVLDDAQHSVVEHPGGPLLVLAGPGTGKTTTLVESAVDRGRARGARRPHPDVDVQSARRRRDARPGHRAPRPTIREPIARTLHSYAFGVLRLANRRADLGEAAPATPAVGRRTGHHAARLGRGAYPAHWPAELRPALRTRAFAGELRDLLMRAVERGLDGPALVRSAGPARAPTGPPPATSSASTRTSLSLARPAPTTRPS